MLDEEAGRDAVESAGIRTSTGHSLCDIRTVDRPGGVPEKPSQVLST